jgi:AraC family transcriptional regulator, regulatory protein of adaptative response / DNA-3-methyladenine glycosylase II
MRAVPGLEEVVDGVYRRTVRVPDGPAVIALGAGAISDSAAANRLRGSARAAAAADAHFGADPVLGPLVARRPGLRVPGTVDGGELAIRAVLGQQISLAAARTLAARLVALAGDPLPDALSTLGHLSPHPDVVGTLTHLWPRPEAVVAAASALPMPGSRRRAIAALAEALAAGDLRLEPGADPAETRARLVALPGIGPWTAEYVALRALADPDAWMPTDLGIRRGLARLDVGPEAAEAWRPFRGHAMMHVWAA